MNTKSLLIRLKDLNERIKRGELDNVQCQDRESALHDLLAPTIELIKEQLKIGMLPERRVLFEKELSRLRSITEMKP